MFHRLRSILTGLFNHPAQIIVFSFASITGIGTFLLLLPGSAKQAIGFTDALFTATSAVCVTGLTVLDTGSHFTRFGQTVIMLLIQAGGLNLMVLSAAAGFLIARKISFQNKRILAFMLNERNQPEVSRLIGSIVFSTLIIELAGAILLFPLLRKGPDTPGGLIFSSFFHSISAFCNAGFSLFPGSLEPFRASPGLNMVIAGLIVLGGLGFPVIRNFSAAVRDRVRDFLFPSRRRLDSSPVRLSLNTRLVLSMTVLLLVSGTVFIYALEHGASLSAAHLAEQYLASFFQSVTLRTAGFNTMDISGLRPPTLIIMILFMFIGGASGSMAGGIKVNTAGVIAAYLRSLLQGRRETLLAKRTIPSDLVRQALFIVLLSFAILFFGIFALSLTETRQDPVRLAFEAASAFGTVGLSTGITPDLSHPGRYIVVILMFLGRIGPLTLLTALSAAKKSEEVKYPMESIQIG